MGVFIFQSTEGRFDLRQAIRPGEHDTWYASRYRGEMHPGTPVFFWMAGDERIRGLYGWGIIASEPYKKSEWDSYGVDVVYEVRFSIPILAVTLRPDPKLSDMLIFRAAQATNFLLSDVEAARLIEVVKGQGEQAPEIKA